MSMEAILQRFSGSLLDRNHLGHVDLPFFPGGGDSVNASPSPPSSGVSSERDSSEEGDFSDATLKLINQMLMEEDDLENKPCMFQDCLALQATEKSFYDVLGQNYPPPSGQTPPFNLGPSGDDKISSPYEDDSSRDFSAESSNSSAAVNSNLVDPNWDHDGDKLERFHSIFQSVFQVQGSSNESKSARLFIGKEAKVADSFPDYGNLDFLGKIERDHSPNGFKEKKIHNREDGDYTDHVRSNKQLASSAVAEPDVDQLDMYDKVLLCPHLNPHLHDQQSFSCPDDHHENALSGKIKGSSGGGKGRAKKQGNKKEKEVVDLRSLLSQCAQAVARADSRSANELLNQIRQYSSPHGDGTERLAHYFANALDARLAGTGTSLYAAFTTKRISAADILKGYQVYVKACPYNKMSNMLANRSIGQLAENASRLHIIDFGILYGFQWPCLIQHLSVRPGGPPRIRITGIDFPQPGFRPAERVQETGRHLATYCRRFNVQFEYTAIAKKWETIKLEDLKIDNDEVLVVNCLYRLRNVPDETVVVNNSNPRDDVLKLVKRINPDMFIHGVVNGTYNAPFFVTRFREALFHFSAGFDMFEATVPREERFRMLFEQEVLGRDVINVIACEGSERVERPETYKQWQVRTVRAGFRQVPLNREIVRDVRAMVKSHYHKDFVVDEDGNWVLQGWKGRIVNALSCWKPVQD